MALWFANTLYSHDINLVLGSGEGRDHFSDHLCIFLYVLFVHSQCDFKLSVKSRFEENINYKMPEFTVILFILDSTYPVHKVHFRKSFRNRNFLSPNMKVSNRVCALRYLPRSTACDYGFSLSSVKLSPP